MSTTTMTLLQRSQLTNDISQKVDNTSTLIRPESPIALSTVNNLSPKAPNEPNPAPSVVIVHPENDAPDGGYGWVVVSACSLIT